VGSRRRPTGPDKLTIEGLYLRCDGLCEGCGEPLRGERGAPHGHAAHHRRPRRMGGSQLPDTNEIENLLLLNEDCHLYVESHRTWAYEHGFLVRQGDVPAAVPVRLHGVKTRGSRVVLTDDAAYRPVRDVPDGP
jgi:hypothetical protein